MTLIEIRGGDGRLIGRCDARCHDAVSHECNCCCGGRNHGKGLARAVAQTREQAQAMIPEHWKALGEARIPVIELSESEVQEKIAQCREARRSRRIPIGKLSDLRGAEFMQPLIQL